MMAHKRNPSKIKGKQASSKLGDKVGTLPKKSHGMGDESLERRTAALQGLILNIFRDSFRHRFDASLPSLIQGVKQHLFNRDFDKAFGRQEYLEAYAVRWSPSRALAYVDILHSLPSLSDPIKALLLRTGQREITEDLIPAAVPAETKYEPLETMTTSEKLPGNLPLENVNIACLGAGAGAEILALAGYLHGLYAEVYGELPPSHTKFNTDLQIRPLAVKVVDIADWSNVVKELYSSTTTSPELSKYASSASKAINAPLVDSRRFSVSFDQQDVLDMEVERLAAVLQDAVLVTLMFTLNELYTASMSKATNLLLTMTYLMQPGSLLLIVDSPGSYSVVELGKITAEGSAVSEKRYPMQLLLDHTLIEASSIGSSRNTSQGGQWEKIASHDSNWFRLPQNLKYPLDLEDMRYQLHLYKRT